MCSKSNLCAISFGITLAIILSGTVELVGYQIYPTKLINTVSNVYNIGEEVVTGSMEWLSSDGKIAWTKLEDNYFWLKENMDFFLEKKDYYWDKLKDNYSWLLNKIDIAWNKIDEYPPLFPNLRTMEWAKVKENVSKFFEQIKGWVK